MSEKYYCINEACKNRHECKKSISVVGERQTPVFYSAKSQFHTCKQFECLDHHFDYVHGETAQQCRECGMLEIDAIEFRLPSTVQPISVIKTKVLF